MASPAKTDDRETIAVGDFVFVDQAAESPLRHLTGTAGIVVVIDESKATLKLSSGETLQLDVDALRLNRRRKARAVSWNNC